MRRTTISRSSLTTLAALLALAAPALRAQVSAPNIMRPVNAARGAAGQMNQNIERQQAPGSATDTSNPGRRSVQLGTPGTPEGSTGFSQSQNPGTHVVQRGETLWALAQQYMGDPLLWPELYRLNTNVVEDPHWIYPGEELRLSALSASTVVVQQDLSVTPGPDTLRVTPVSSPLNGPTIFSNPSARVRGGTSVELMNARAYRAVRPGEYFSSGFLTENQPLNTGHIDRTSAELRDVARTRNTANIYENVTLTPPEGVDVARGDLLLAFKRGDQVGDYGEIIIPTGLVRAGGPAGTGNNLLNGTVIALYGSLEAHQELLKVQPFVNNSNLRALPVAGGLEGTVLRMRDNRNVAQMQDIVFIDKGANDGLRLGDIVKIFVTRPDVEHGGSLEQDQGRAIIVSTRSRTATAIIVQLYRGDVGSQSQFRLIRRMPS